MSQSTSLLDVAWSTPPVHKNHKLAMQAMVGVTNDADTDARLPIVIMYGPNKALLAGFVHSIRIVKIHEELSEWAPRNIVKDEELKNIVDEFIVFTLRATLGFVPNFCKQFRPRATPTGQLTCRPQLGLRMDDASGLYLSMEIKNWREMFEKHP